MEEFLFVCTTCGNRVSGEEMQVRDSGEIELLPDDGVTLVSGDNIHDAVWACTWCGGDVRVLLPRGW